MLTVLVKEWGETNKQAILRNKWPCLCSDVVM